MLITFDIDLLIENKLNAHQLMMLHLIKENELDRLIQYLKETNKLDQFIQEDIDKLIEKGFLRSFRKGAYDFKNLRITDKFIKFVSGGDLFQELVEHYPTTVTRPDGKQDYLLTGLSKIKPTYIKLTQNNKALHEFILRCLQEEIEEKEETDSMSYMKRLPNWIAERGWESYKERVGHLQSVRGNSTHGYGERIE